MIQERDDIVALDSAIIQHPRTWEASGHLAGFTDPLVAVPRQVQAALPRRTTCARRPRRAASRPTHLVCPVCGGELSEPRAFNLMFETTIGPVKEAGSTVYLRPRDRAGHLPRLQAGAAVRAPQAAVRHRAGRQVVPQRDHARQLHLPHARVRADGDGVLRPARRGRRSGTSTGCSERFDWYVAARDRPGPPAPARARRRRAVALLVRAPATSSTSTRSAGRSWRGSPTAATST